MLYRAHARRNNLLRLVLAVFGLLISTYAEAAPYKPKDTKVNQSEVGSYTVSYTFRKKTFSKSGSCYKAVPGKSFIKKKVLFFRALKEDSKLLSSQIKQFSGDSKKVASLKKKLEELKAFIKASANACASSGPGGSPPPGAPPPSVPTALPDRYNLEHYNGPFGEAEARHLLNRFGMAPTTAEIDAAVARGLDATVQELTNWKAEPGLEAYNADLECDGRAPGDPNNDTCDTSRINDLYVPGFRYAWYYGALKTQNPLFYRTWLFLHDDFMAVNSNALGGCDQHAIKGYKDLLWRASQSGNLRQYLKEFMTDQLGALRYLNLGASRAPIPNQDFARELWQLGALGQNRPTTNDLNYDELDIIAAANILAGWSIETFQNSYGDYVCYGAKIPGLSVPGSQVVFHGTPFETLVSSPDELLEATFRHPSTSENIANKIYLEFVNPVQPPPYIIQEMARTLRDNGFNLNASLRQLMLSKAFFDPANRRSEYKHPLQLVLGFLRQTGVPFDSYGQLENILTSLGQRPYQAPSVFGWYPDRLSGEAYVLERRNALNWFVTQGDSYYETKHYSFYDTFLTNLPSGQSPTTVVIQRVARALGVNLNAAQMASLDQYMNFQLVNWNCPSQCGGQPTRLIRDVFDPFKGADNQGGNWSRQIRGLILILASLPQYQTN